MLFFLWKTQEQEVNLLTNKVPGVIMFSFFTLCVYSKLLTHNQIYATVGPYFLKLKKINVYTPTLVLWQNTSS